MSALVDGAVTAAIKNVRDDKSSDDWVLVGYGGPEEVTLLGTGTGGIEALRACLPENDVCYGLLRKEVTKTDNNSPVIAYHTRLLAQIAILHFGGLTCSFKKKIRIG
jgi:Cofilin/tropomyosin-type actin-binding protein